MIHWNTLMQWVTQARVTALIGGGGKSTLAAAAAEWHSRSNIGALITTTTRIWLPSSANYTLRAPDDVYFLGETPLPEQDRRLAHVLMASPLAEEGPAGRGAILAAGSQATSDSTKLLGLTASRLCSLMHTLRLHEKALTAIPYESQGTAIQEIEHSILEGVEESPGGENASAATKWKSPRYVVLVEADGSAGLPFKAHASHEPVIPPCANLVILVVGLDALGHPWEEVTHRPALALQRLAHAMSPVPPRVTSEALAHLIVHPQEGFRACQNKRLAVVLNKSDLLTGAEMRREALHLVALLENADIPCWMGQLNDIARGGKAGSCPSKKSAWDQALRRDKR